MTKPRSLRCINSFQLKILAMALMLCDHLWATLIPGNRWLTDIGRLAFPIFAFQIAEGFFRTHDYKKYLKRIFIFALISEIPFNLMYSGEIFYPFHQNVLFTFCIALLLMAWIERAGEKGKGKKIGTALFALLSGWLAGTVLMTDYFGFGVLTVLLFYFSHGRKYGELIELAGLIFINCYMISGMDIPFTLAGREFFIPQQGFAVLALIPILLYNGERGRTGRKLQYSLYLFYPLHMLVLYLISAYMN